MADDKIWQSRNTTPCPIAGMCLRDAPRALSAQGRAGLTPSVSVASAGVENGGAGRCLTATLTWEARRG